MPLAGFGPERKPSDRIQSRLEANAILLQHGDQRVVLMQVDVVSVGAGTRRQLLERLSGKLQDRQLLLVASHTHFAPNIDASLPGLGVVDQDYIALVVDRLIALLNRVLSAERRPVSLLYREGQAAHSINRRAWCWAPSWSIPPVKRRMGLHPNPKGPKDDTVRMFALSGNAPGGRRRSPVLELLLPPRRQLPAHGNIGRLSRRRSPGTSEPFRAAHAHRVLAGFFG